MKHLLTSEASIMTALWPPLALIRADLLGEASAYAQTPPLQDGEDAPQGAGRSSGTPEALLIDLARRRQAARARFAEQRWEPGCVVQVRQGTAHASVLLDHQDVQAASWHGWLTSAEPDWAGPHDVLLEEVDEPADPSASVIQAWNRVQITQPEPASAVLAHLSPARLAAVRGAWAESLGSPPSASEAAMPSAPGHVALRETEGGHTVLTGTPIGPNDPRLEHQALYRELSQRLSEASQASILKTAATSVPASPSWWTRFRSSLRLTDGWLRPAFALMALVVVTQQWVIWQGAQDDDVRFRGGMPPVTQTAALVVRWQPTTRIEDAQALLNSLPAAHDTSILPDGRWLIELNDPVTARAHLSASQLVQSVEGP